MSFLPFSSKTCQKNIIKQNSLSQLSETPQVNFNCRFLGKSVINNFIQSEARKYVLYLAWKKKQSRRRGVNDLDFHKWQMTLSCLEPPWMAGIPTKCRRISPPCLSCWTFQTTPGTLGNPRGCVCKIVYFIRLGKYSQNCIHNQAIKSHFQQQPWCAGSPPNFQHCPLFWASFIVFLETCVMAASPTRKNGENKAWLSSLSRMSLAIFAFSCLSAFCLPQ